MFELLNKSGTDNPAPPAEFVPVAADLTLLGTTDARNPWRLPLIHALHELGVDDSRIHTPVITGRAWGPEIDGLNELFQKKHAKSALVYVGNNGSGNPSMLSGTESVELAYARPQGTVLVMLDDNGLSDHAKKQLRQLRQNLEHPQSGDKITRVVPTIGEALPWIAERLNLKDALANYAVKCLAESLSTQLQEAMSGYSPDKHEAYKFDQGFEEARRWIEYFDAQMKEFPYEKSWHLPNAGISPNQTSEKKYAADIVIRHFRENGWMVGSNRHGALVVGRSDPD